MNLDREILLHEEGDRVMPGLGSPSATGGPPEGVDKTPTNRQLAGSLAGLEKMLKTIQNSVSSLHQPGNGAETVASTAVPTPNTATAPITVQAGQMNHTKCHVPKFQEETTLDQYLMQVELWQQASGIDPSKMAVLLLMNFRYVTSMVGCSRLSPTTLRKTILPR